MKQYSFKELRQRSKLTQVQFAKEMGVQWQYVSLLERQEIRIPPKYFPAISKLCKISVRTLIEMDVDRHRRRVQEKVRLAL